MSTTGESKERKELKIESQRKTSPNPKILVTPFDQEWKAFIFSFNLKASLGEESFTLCEKIFLDRPENGDQTINSYFVIFLWF